MFQQLSVIKKTATRVDHYFKVNGYILIHNLQSNELTLVFGDDGLCGMTDLESALKHIGWDANQPYKTEYITWNYT